jgi:hypothetical protein
MDDEEKRLRRAAVEAAERLIAILEAPDNEDLDGEEFEAARLLEEEAMAELLRHRDPNRSEQDR